MSGSRSSVVVGHDDRCCHVDPFLTPTEAIVASRALSGRRPSDLRRWRTDAGIKPGHTRSSAQSARLVPVPRPWSPPAGARRSRHGQSPQLGRGEVVGLVVSVRTRARVTERVRLRARVWVTVFLRVRMGRLSLVRRSQQDDGEGLSAMRWSEGLTVSWWPHR